jgi:hypothetical protein
LLVGQASAYKISASPEEIILNLTPNEEVCRDIEVESDSENLDISTWWSAKKSRTITTFTYEASEVGVTIFAPEHILGKRGVAHICAQVKDSYAHYGVVIIEDREKSAGLGVWLTINPNSPEKSITKERTRPSITGAVPQESTQEPQKDVDIARYLMIGTVLLTLALAVLILKIRKKARV